MSLAPFASALSSPAFGFFRASRSEPQKLPRNALVRTFTPIDGMMLMLAILDVRAGASPIRDLD